MLNTLNTVKHCEHKHFGTSPFFPHISRNISSKKPQNTRCPLCFLGAYNILISPAIVHLKHIDLIKHFELIEQIWAFNHFELFKHFDHFEHFKHSEHFKHFERILIDLKLWTLWQTNNYTFTSINFFFHTARKLFKKTFKYIWHRN